MLKFPFANSLSFFFKYFPYIAELIFVTTNFLPAIHSRGARFLKFRQRELLYKANIHLYLAIS